MTTGSRSVKFFKVYQMYAVQEEKKNVVLLPPAGMENYFGKQKSNHGKILHLVML